MFGFVVKNIDIPNNSIKISGMNKDKFGAISQENLILVKTDVNEGLYEYISNYTLSSSSLQLLHIFFDFSSIVE